MQTISFSLGSNRAATASSRRHSCPSPQRRAVLQLPIAAPRRMKRGSGLRSKLLHSVFRSSGRTISRRLPGVDCRCLATPIATGLSPPTGPTRW